jgi:drug/metabolite transporter (DMT)-like permease
MLVLFKTEGAAIEITNAWGVLKVLATLLYGFAGNILKEDIPDLSATTVMSIAFVSMGIPASFILFSSGFSFLTIFGQAMQLHSIDSFWNNHHLTSFAAVVALSTFGSAISMLLLSKLVKKSNALFASFTTYLIPFIALMWGWLDGEGVSYLQSLSLIMILGGILLANSSKIRFGKKIKEEKEAAIIR